MSLTVVVHSRGPAKRSLDSDSAPIDAKHGFSYTFLGTLEVFLIMVAVVFSYNICRLLCCLVLFVLCLPVSLAEPIRIGTIKIGDAGFVKNNQAAGSLFEMHNLILNAAEIDSVNMVIPYQRLALMVAQNEIDVTTASHPSSLSQNMFPVALLFTAQMAVIAKKNLELRSNQDLYGKTVAVLRGSSLSYFVQNPKIIRYDLNSPTQGMKMLSMGRVDGVITSLYAIETTLAKLGLSLTEFSPPLVVETRECWLLYNKNTAIPEILLKLKNVVDKLRDNGEIEKIFLSYGGDEPHPAVKIFGREIAE